MYKNILLAIDLNDEASCRKPLLSAVELARTFGARVHVLTVVREVEAILQAKTAPLGYDLIAADLENRIAALIRRVNASDLKPNILVTHNASIYAGCALQARRTQLPEMAAAAKPSEQPRTESCVASGNGRCEA